MAAVSGTSARDSGLCPTTKIKLASKATRAAKIGTFLITIHLQVKRRRRRLCARVCGVTQWCRVPER
ncbi:hypothetical protein GCM10010452_33000 [Crossiella cryophila]